MPATSFYNELIQFSVMCIAWVRVLFVCDVDFFKSFSLLENFFGCCSAFVCNFIIKITFETRCHCMICSLVLCALLCFWIRRIFKDFAFKICFSRISFDFVASFFHRRQTNGKYLFSVSLIFWNQRFELTAPLLSNEII